MRWCPGCGDYSILKTVRAALAETGAKPEDTVFVSGIGCSSRFPYYLETYGYHTIHGRAPAIATGVKLANPDLDVWIVTGDGDGLSIGGNHMAHLLRRNLNCQVLLFNNEIYGLTKGQYSPTSRQGTRSPSTPYGSVEQPTNPSSFALGAGGRFVARAFDIAQKELLPILKRAHAHKGTSFVEIYQNCAVFNDGAFSGIAGKGAPVDAVIWLRHGEPMLFAKGAKGLRLNRQQLRLETVDVADGDWEAAGVLLHDETCKTLAHLLIDMPAKFPHRAWRHLLRSGTVLRRCRRRPGPEGCGQQKTRPPEATQLGRNLVHRRKRFGRRRLKSRVPPLTLPLSPWERGR